MSVELDGTVFNAFYDTGLFGCVDTGCNQMKIGQVVTVKKLKPMVLCKMKRIEMQL